MTFELFWVLFFNPSRKVELETSYGKTNQLYELGIPLLSAIKVLTKQGVENETGDYLMQNSMILLSSSSLHSMKLQSMMVYSVNLEISY